MIERLEMRGGHNYLYSLFLLCYGAAMLIEKGVIGDDPTDNRDRL